MSKAVLISIQPEWCELIANGEKTVEVRKTKPKLETPFKTYIYCTSPRKSGDIFLVAGKTIQGNGKVIGEFICDRIDEYTNYSLDEQSGHIKRREDLLRSACMTLKDWRDYIGSYKSDFGYAWHISNLVIYDKPRELSEFVTEGDCSCENCRKCKWMDRGNGYNVEDDCLLSYTNSFGKSLKPLFRPPQSWCYVEEV